MNNQLISLLPDSKLSVLVKITEKGHSDYKKLMVVKTTLSELLNSGLPAILIEGGIFESMGHPYKHFDLVRLEVQSSFVQMDNPALPDTPQPSVQILNEADRGRLIQGKWVEETNEIDPKSVKVVIGRMAASSNGHHVKIYGAVGKYVDSKVNIQGLCDLLVDGNPERLDPALMRGVLDYVIDPKNPIVIISASVDAVENFARVYFDSGLKDPRIIYMANMEQTRGARYKYAFTVNSGNNYYSRNNINDIEVQLERRGCKVLQAY